MEQYRPLNHNQLRFVVEFLSVMPRNATEAYLRVHPDASRATAGVNSSRYMSDPRIVAEIAKRENELRDDLALTVADVVRELFLVASADPRELSEHYVGACRHCHGFENKYQHTPAEFERATAAHIEARRKSDNPDPFGLEFDIKGGVGFNPHRDPNPDCGECFGEGVGYQVFKDTRTLSRGAARLYAGVKQTRDGLEIKMRDQSKTLDMAMAYLGMNKSKVEHTGPNGKPIQTANVTISTVTTDPIEAASLYQKLIAG